MVDGGGGGLYIINGLLGHHEPEVKRLKVDINMTFINRFFPFFVKGCDDRGVSFLLHIYCMYVHYTVQHFYIPI